MTLDEAIKHCEEVAQIKEEDAEKWRYTLNEYRKRTSCEPKTIPICKKELKECLNCASEYRQLAEWLRELKAYRERIPSHEAGYNDVIKEIALSEECARAYTRGYEKAMEYCTNKLSELNKQFANGGKR